MLVVTAYHAPLADTARTLLQTFGNDGCLFR